MNNQLPIKQIFIEGIKMPFVNYKQLIGFGWPYAFVTLAIALTTQSILWFTVFSLDPSYMLSLAENTIWLMVGVIEICFLSLSYQWIVSEQDNNDRNQDMLA